MTAPASSRWPLGVVDVTYARWADVADRARAAQADGFAHIDPMLGTGRVNVAGQDWAARSEEPVATGTRVRVVAADGIVLEVRRS